MGTNMLPEFRTFLIKTRNLIADPTLGAELLSFVERLSLSGRLFSKPHATISRLVRIEGHGFQEVDSVCFHIHTPKTYKRSDYRKNL